MPCPEYNCSMASFCSWDKTPNTQHTAVLCGMNASLPTHHKPHWLVALAGPALSTSFCPMGICCFLLTEILPRPLVTLLLTKLYQTFSIRKAFLINPHHPPLDQCALLVESQRVLHFSFK